MSLRLLQLRAPGGARRLAVANDLGPGRLIAGFATTLDLARAAVAQGLGLAEIAARLASGGEIDLNTELAEGRILAPIDHPDPAHLILSGTGLTHLGSAEGRDKMHKTAAGQGETDSMKMFRMGLEGGKPPAGQIGVQPEWFYKGDGSGIVAPGAPLRSPSFALDGSEEPEVAGVYLIDGSGRPLRLGFCLANEFSDHVTERGNYLWLAHSKLRPAALGPELLTGDLPAAVEGASRVWRDGAVLWEKPFLSGEANMSHTLANLEHHHFKHPGFRKSGDIHVHFFGTATLSFSDGVRTVPGDVFEIEAAPFRLPLRNVLATDPHEPIAVSAL
jgi:hypothetical protein